MFSSNQLSIKRNLNGTIPALQELLEPFVVISAPSGFGKTYLLNTLKKERENKGWNVIAFNLNELDSEKSFLDELSNILSINTSNLNIEDIKEQIINSEKSLLDKLSNILSINTSNLSIKDIKEQIINKVITEQFINKDIKEQFINNLIKEQLTNKLLSLSKYKDNCFLFIFDNITNRNRSVLKKITRFFEEYKTRAENNSVSLYNYFQVIFSGSYITSKHFVIKTQIKWQVYHKYSLAPIDNEMILELLEEQLKKDGKNELYEKQDCCACAKEIANLSAGHIEIIFLFIKELRKQYLSNNINCLSGFILDNKLNLYIDISNKALDKLLSPMYLKQEDFDLIAKISVFRSFDLSVITECINDKSQAEIKAFNLFEMLLKISDERPNKHSNKIHFYIDDVCRKLVIKKIQLFEPEKYKNYISNAFYYHKETFKKNNDKVNFLACFYHCLQQYAIEDPIWKKNTFTLINQGSSIIYTDDNLKAIYDDLHNDHYINDLVNEYNIDLEKLLKNFL